MPGGDGRKIIGYCIHCKDPIYEGKKYVIDENKYMLHGECNKLIEDCSISFGD